MSPSTNAEAGEIQGQYIVDHHKKGDKVVMINGSKTDNNALLFYQGAMNLKPLYDSGELVKVYDQYTPDWNNATAQTEMEAGSTANKNDVQIAYVANDGMANNVIAALKAQKLNGKVLSPARMRLSSVSRTSSLATRRCRSTRLSRWKSSFDRHVGKALRGNLPSGLSMPPPRMRLARIFLRRCLLRSRWMARTF